MPPLSKPIPSRRAPFDPWNSSSTGHQRAETRPGTSWRDTRRRKLDVQFGGRRSSAQEAQERDDARGGRSLPPRRSVVDMLRRPGLMKADGKNSRNSGKHGDAESRETRELVQQDPETMSLRLGDGIVPEAGSGTEAEAKYDTTNKGEDVNAASSLTVSSSLPPLKRGIFSGTSIYVNGSTFPHISDHKLKHLITQHGGYMALHLGRRTVTHVVLGTSGRGGLAGGKMDKEVRRMRGCGVYFVGVEWVLESLKSGKRLPEARFSNARLARSGQASVYDQFSRP
ncbi:hypothetical protein E4U56_006778 [Claviceps arundinis]|uniref:BRCT domain-containing protein n=1 Tax=Claviceps arundinis TaxID=1623583 RepID=A0A9P7SPW8_9HYPO|nr:hypothetical protein E4U56_006778 [Claviceps arundinis]